MIKEGILITVAAAAMNFGTIYENNGSVSHRFWLHNVGCDSVKVIQTFPSCGCTSIAYSPKSFIQPNDSLGVDVSFNPKHRGGEFYETASIVLASLSDTSVVTLSVEGNVITSEETLMKQYPIRRGDIRLTADTLDMGEVRRGEKKTMYLGILLKMDGVLRNMDRAEKKSIPVTFVADEKAKWGAQNVKVNVPVSEKDKHCEEITLKALVIPNITNQQSAAASKPHVKSLRSINVNAKSINIANDGSSWLTVYRVYAEDGTDMTNGELHIAEGDAVEIPVKGKGKRITIISNDPRRPRFVIRRN